MSAEPEAVSVALKAAEDTRLTGCEALAAPFQAFVDPIAAYHHAGCAHPPVRR